MATNTPLLCSLDRDTLIQVLCQCSCRDVLSLSVTCRELHAPLQVIHCCWAPPSILPLLCSLTAPVIHSLHRPSALLANLLLPAHPTSLLALPACLHRRTTCCGVSWLSKSGGAMLVSWLRWSPVAGRPGQSTA